MLKCTWSGLPEQSVHLLSPRPVLPEAPKSDGSDDRDEEPREQQEQGEREKDTEALRFFDICVPVGAVRAAILGILGSNWPKMGVWGACGSHVGAIWEKFESHCAKNLFGGHAGPFGRCLGTIWEPFGGQFGGLFWLILSLGTVKMRF